MIEAGARFEVTDQSLRTPLHLAQTRAIADFLCSLGADLLAKDDQGRTPLHTACHEVRADVVDFLISRVSSVNELATEDQWKPLHFATCGRHHFNSHVHVPEESWNTATLTSRLQTAQILLKNGANIQATASDGHTALHGTANKGDINLIHFLLEQGATVTAATVAGETALHTVITISAIQILTES
jgi:ankyrin repeat protein